MPQIKYHGATLAQADVKKYFPINATFPHFKYFLFHYEKDSNGAYFFKVYAVDKDGKIIGTVPVTKDIPTVPIDFTTWVPTDMYIGVTNQLNKVPVAAGQAIKEIKLRPKKDPVYDAVSYEVKITVGQAFAVFTEELKPSPPASVAENDWTF